jgi:hypothetical protein
MEASPAKLARNHLAILYGAFQALARNPIPGHVGIGMPGANGTLTSSDILVDIAAESDLTRRVIP